MYDAFVWLAYFRYNDLIVKVTSLIAHWQAMATLDRQAIMAIERVFN